MMCQWGWRGRNNLQVGEMRHEWLPSLSCAVLLVCVRSRQIPSVLSPFASVMGGWGHQFFPLSASASSSVGSPTPFLQAAVSWKCKESTWLTSLKEQPWKLGPLLQLPSSTYWTGHSQRANSTVWEKGVRKWNFWVLLKQWHILPCLSPPDLMHSWIMVCCPLHTFHNNSVYTFAALGRVAQEYLTWLWNTSSPLRNNRVPFVTVSFLSELLFLGSVHFCTENIESSFIYRINEHTVNSNCLKLTEWAG